MKLQHNSMYGWWVRSRYLKELALAPAAWALSLTIYQRPPRLPNGPGDELCCNI
jgi:hypothetical protein